MTELVPPIGIGLAFIAGVVSFLSPCVAPLVPGYLSYITGTSLEKFRESKGQLPHILFSTSLFVLGFTLVFVSLGASASALGSLLEAYRRELTRAAGVVMILMGILLTGLVPLPFLSREFRLHPQTKQFGLLGNIPLGMAFAFGWLPCVGPILASILFYAGAADTVAQGTLLLLVYSLGLGLSFILTGVFFVRVLGALRWVQRHYRFFNMASGGLLILVGLLFVTNRFYYLSLLMQRIYYRFFY